MTPPGSVLISAYIQRGLAYEAKGDYAHAKEDYNATLEGVASDAGSKANQATAKVRLALLSDAVAPPALQTPAPKTTPEQPPASAPVTTPSPIGEQRPPRRAGDRQRRLCPCQGAAEPAQRCACDREEFARPRFCRRGRHRSRPRGDAEDHPRFPARRRARADRGAVFRRAFRSTAAISWCRWMYGCSPASIRSRP